MNSESRLPSMVMSRPGRSAEPPSAARDLGKHGLGRWCRPKRYKLPRNLVRGQGYLTAHGGLGYYVGTTPWGRHWFCFGRLEDLRAMCERFDERYPQAAKRMLVEA